MSVEAMAWAFKQKINDAQSKLILLAICDHADENGLCWPSLERLAEKSACSHDTVTRRIRILEKSGFLISRRRARKTTMYRITLYKNAVNTQILRDQALVPTEAEKAEMLNTQKPLMDTQIDIDEYATGASLTIKSNHQEVSKRERATRLPPQWTATERGIEFAISKGFTRQQAEIMEAAMINFYTHGPGFKTKWIDWYRCWQGWVNRERGFQKAKQWRNRNEKPDLADRIREYADEARELERRAGIGRPAHTV